MPVREKKTLGLEWNWRIYDLSPRSTLISNVSRRLFFRIFLFHLSPLILPSLRYTHLRRYLVEKTTRSKDSSASGYELPPTRLPTSRRAYIYIYIYLFPIASFRLVLYRDLDIFLYSVLSIPSSIDNYYIFLGNNDRSSLFLYFSFLLLLLSFSFLYLFFLFLFYFILFF